jgi:hypothetical protein
MWPSRRWGFRTPAAAAVAAALALASCASTPPARQAPLEAARFALFPDAYALFALRLSPAVRSAAAGLLPGGARPLLDRAERIYGVATPGAVYAAAEGRFSRGSVGTGLALAGGWKRLEPNRWRAADGSLEAAVPASGLLLIGTGDLAPLLATRATRAAEPAGFAMPPAAAAALAAADAFGYVPAVAPEAAAGLPVRSAWAAFADDGGLLRGEATLLLAADSGGRLLALAGRALVTRLLRDAGVADVGTRLRDVTVTADAGLLRIRGLVLSPDEIVTVVGALEGLLR